MLFFKCLIKPELVHWGKCSTLLLFEIANLKQWSIVFINQRRKTRQERA